MKRMRLSSAKGTCVWGVGGRGEHERNDPSRTGGGVLGLPKEIFLVQNDRRSDSNAF